MIDYDEQGRVVATRSPSGFGMIALSMMIISA